MARACGKAPSHRVLALRRGEDEGVLVVHATPPEGEAIGLLEGIFVRGSGPASRAGDDCCS